MNAAEGIEKDILSKAGSFFKHITQLQWKICFISFSFISLAIFVIIAIGLCDYHMSFDDIWGE